MSALEKYREAARLAYEMSEIGEEVYMPVVDVPLADAAIAELSAEANKWCEDWGDAQKRIAELEAENKRGYRFFSMCQDGHERIGWKPDEWEECPVCRATSRAEQAEAELAALTEKCGKCPICNPGQPNLCDDSAAAATLIIDERGKP